MKISRSQIECYRLKGDAFNWAEISINEGNNAGRVSISSDFGNWAYYWGACGCSFKEFLIGLDIHYAAGKFGEDRWFDLDKTLCVLEDRIMGYEGDDQDYKSRLLKEFHELKEQSNTEAEFVYFIQNCETIMHMEDHLPDMVNDISPCFKSFWQRIWKPFVENLKIELLNLKKEKVSKEVESL